MTFKVTLNDGSEPQTYPRLSHATSAAISWVRNGNFWQSLGSKFTDDSYVVTSPAGRSAAIKKI